VRQGTDKQEGVLCAYGILGTEQQGLRHLALGSRESDDAWLSFLHDVTARGLKAPLLVISDGQPGLGKALREVFPQAFHQWCQVNKHPGQAAAGRAGPVEAAPPPGVHAAKYEQGLPGAAR
jgi:transposase-like protein